MFRINITIVAGILAAGILGAAFAAQPTDENGGASHVHYIDGPRQDAPIPRPGVALARGKFAVVVIDPQNDFLSPQGVAWGVVGKSVKENGTVENIGRLFQAAQRTGAPVFVSPHYYYHHDHQWKFEGALEALMHDIGMFDRAGALTTEGFEGSGADWLEQYKPYINDGKTGVTSPHKG